MRALVVSVGDERYTVPLDAVQEVVAEPALTTVPTAPATVLGVVNLRGDVVPVLDTGLLAGGDALGAARYAVVVRTARGPAALATAAEPQTATLGEPLRGEGGVLRHRVDDGLAAPADIDALVGAV